MDNLSNQICMLCCGKHHDDKTTTKCGHTFCKPCWDKILIRSHWELVDKTIYPHIPGFHDPDITCMGEDYIQAWVHCKKCPACNEYEYLEEWYEEIRRYPNGIKPNSIRR